MLLFGNLTPQLLVSVIIAVLIGMTFHEFAHNYVAYLMGDDVPLREGRLTLNPMVHINPLGFIMFVLIGFGILGTAPISAQRMGYKRLGVRFGARWGYLLAVAAGPFSNLLLAAVFALIFHLLSGFILSSDVLSTLVYQLIFWNVLLFVFNLLPFFPIDGWHIVYSLLPADLADTWARYAQTSQYILLGLILLGFLRIPGLNILGSIIYQPTSNIVAFLLGF
ncbi:MAG: site-2 protease family protein [Chloroflexota bacterium]